MQRSYVETVQNAIASSEPTSLSPEDRAALGLLERLGQKHLIERWPESGQDLAGKRRMLAQIRELDARYPGGLERYLAHAKDLIEQSSRGESPYQDCVPHVPEGIHLDFGGPEFRKLEAQGLNEVSRCGFALVAGGLGERLGFQGVKPALCAESATGQSFLALYAAQLLALQRRAGERNGELRKLPLVIMTSDDTDAGVRSLLIENQYFGLAAGQVTLLKQDKVAALADPAPRLALDPDDPYQVLTKPHGHGDLHVLMHQTGLAARWLQQGLRWLICFQDTNPLTFNVVLATLAVSAREQLDVNSIAVPRQPGEAAGALVRLVKPDSELTVNVEYNQLDALLRAAPGGRGDVAGADGYSPYPGNINVLVFGLPTYVKTLEATGGAVPEFVNPKYADERRQSFKTPTRLECMMQDFSRLLAKGRVGFTLFERSVCFSPAKNSLPDAAARQAKQPPLPAESASSAEADVYAFHRRVLELSGAVVQPGPNATYRGVSVALFPIVWLAPRLITPLSNLLGKLENVRVASRSALVVDADDLQIIGLDLDGSLLIRAVEGAKITLRGLCVKNEGWQARELGSNSDVPPQLAIRGFCLDKRATLLIEARAPGDYLVEPSTLADAELDPARPGVRVLSL